MNNMKLYKYAAIGLLMVNIAMITFFLLTKPSQKNSPRIEKIFEFDKQQHEQVRILVDEHKKLMRGLKEEQADLLKPYFNTLENEEEQISIDSIITKLQFIEKTKLESTYKHLKDIKALLKPEQLPRYSDFLNTSLGNILMLNKPKRK